MRGKKFLIIALALVMTSLLPLAAGEEVTDKPPSRAPDKLGSITSDETWSGALGVDDVIIEEGVTVTIDKGSVIYMYNEAEIWVRGTLIVQGMEALSDVVTFKLSSGTFWEGITINDTGTADIQNATFSGGHNYIVIRGDDVRLRNLLFDKGWTGVSVYDGSGHDLDHLMGKYINSVVSVSSNPGPIDIHWVHGIEVAHYVVHLSEVNNITVDWIYAADSGTGLRIDGGCGGSCGNITVTRIMVNQTAPAGPTSKGIDLWNPIHGLYLEDITLSTLSFGIDINTAPGSKVTVRDLQTDGSVTTLFNLDQDYHGIELDVYDSILSASSEIANLVSDTADVHMNVISSPMGSGSLSLTGEALFNVSWYLNLTLQDGGLAPLDCTLNTDYHGGGLFSSLDMPDGIGQLILTERSIFETGQTDLFFDLDLVVQNDVPVHYVLGENMHIDENSDLVFVFDIPPYNDMPGDIEFKEDETYEVNLSEFFHDLENDLTYEVSSGPDLDPVLVGGPYPLLTIGTVEDDWNGVSWVFIEATDGGGNVTSANVTIDVLAINDAPRLLIDPPCLEIEEEGTGYFNFTGLVTDPEGDAITWTIPDAEGLDLDWNEENWNLTFTGIENWFGLTEIYVNITDGTNWTVVPIEVNVTPVNDIPVWSLMLKNGTEAPMVEYVYNETTNWTVYLIETDEDVPVEFWIDAEDVETAELLYSFVGADLLHGIVEVEMYQIEVIVNATTNETEMQNVTVPMNFTYTPLENDHLDDVVVFNVSDGEETVSYKVWFKVTPINDPPVFTAPSEWNITVDMDTMSTIDLADMISDIDEDAIIIAEDSNFITVNGAVLEILYTGAYTETSETVTVTVSDGMIEVTATLLININVPADDDDDEPVLGMLEATPKNDGWLFEVTGDEGQTLFVVIEEKDGNFTSYPMTYADGKYSVMIDAEDAEAGLSYHLSDEEDGESLGSDQVGSLTDLASDKDDEDKFPLWIVILILVIIVLVIAIFVLMITGKGKGDDFYDEE